MSKLSKQMDCDNDHYPVIAQVSQTLWASKHVAQMLLVETADHNKLNNEVREQ
jgi:hypothetical protein